LLKLYLYSSSEKKGVSLAFISFGKWKPLSLFLSVLHPINKHIYSGHSHFSAGWSGYFRSHHKSFSSCPLFYLSYSYFADELCFEFPHI
jgi:hypothetical protein